MLVISYDEKMSNFEISLNTFLVIKCVFLDYRIWFVYLYRNYTIYVQRFIAFGE